MVKIPSALSDQVKATILRIPYSPIGKDSEEKIVDGPHVIFQTPYFVKVKGRWDDGFKIIELYVIERREEKIVRLVDRVSSPALGFWDAKKFDWREYMPISKILEKIKGLFSSIGIVITSDEEERLKQQLISLQEKLHESEDMAKEAAEDKVRLTQEKQELEKKIQEKMESNISARLQEIETAIKEFKEKLAKSDVLESDMQVLFTKYPILLGAEYYSSKAKRRDYFGENDFYLINYKGEIHIFELKGPNDLIFQINKDEKRPSENALSPKLSQALNQIVEYLDEVEKECDRHTLLLKDSDLRPGAVPDGFIIISRSSLVPIEKLERFKKYLHRIKIYTYDQMLSNIEGEVGKIKEKEKSISVK